MRTFDRSTFLAAQASWADYGAEWMPLRRQAAERGMLFAPSGSRHDDREAESPSQRAIIFGALRDNPAELRAIVARSGSWSQVVDRIIGLESRLRQDAGDAERDARWERERVPTYAEAVTSIAAIVQRIGESV